ncbi:MAG: hypothetical protein ABIO02_03415 [Patescibacteria group bacterium]
MNTFKKIMIAAGVGLLLYSIFASTLHMPVIGTFLLIPLLLCGAMMLFMNHGSTDEKEGKAHHH